MSSTVQHDVVVVGAGVAGTYAAWRLGNAGVDVALFECSDRVGGRLLSITPPEMPKLRAEFGGMRFLSSQDFVAALIEHVGLATEPFPMGGPANLAFLRNHLLHDSQFSNPNDVPYFVTDGEKGKNPGQLLVEAITKLVPDALKYTPQEWEEAKKTLSYNGRELYNWGLWDAIYSQMSSEAYALLLDGGGYESLADNWNAAEACEHLLADFPSNVSYQRITEGYQRLPETLFAQANVAASYLGWTLESIAPGSTRKLALTFSTTSAQVPTQQTVEADTVILALPQLPLRRVFEHSPAIATPRVNALLSTVTAMPAIKLFLAFETAWWAPLGLTAGRSTTDLPLRQIYYFGEDETDGHALLMAAYADGRTESFWRYLISRDQTPPPLVSDVNLEHALVDEVRRQLSIMHGVEVPEPVWLRVVDWNVDPYGGGWHFWDAGVDVGEAISNIRQPEPTVPLYIAGEAYSNEQGWVEGALNSTEHVLRTAFPHLAIPPWLQNIYLGP